MAVIDICNAALQKVHVHETIPDTVDWDNPVGKAQSVCGMFRNQARQSALRLGYWACIMTRKKLASNTWKAITEFQAGDLIIAGTSVFMCATAGTSAAEAPTWPATGTIADGTVTWTFAYAAKIAMPAENYTGIANASPLPADYLMIKDVTDEGGKTIHYAIESGVLYTNTANPVLVYVRDEQDDAQYDSLLREAVILQTAYEICVPLTEDENKKMAIMQEIAMLEDAAFSKTGKEIRQGVPAPETWRAGLFEKAGE